jgi:GNAT superfamily N-acetyltransferase
MQVPSFHLAPITVWYLSMSARPEIRLELPQGIELGPMLSPISTADYLRLYRAVGDEWHWIDRVAMPADELYEKINQPNTTIYQLRQGTELLGYAEFVVEADHVELQYFGLVPAATGKGLGKVFLNWAIHHAWDQGKIRVQVNTCSKDHPAALGTYQKAKFNLDDTRIEVRKVQD